MATVLYPAGGWLAPGTRFQYQREDQGQDLVIPWQGIIQAPGAGRVVRIGSDRAFPNGFGPSYPYVQIDTGRWAGHQWYIGHCTALVSEGEPFSFGHPLARADQGHDFNGTVGGWVELGEAFGGHPDSFSTNHWYRPLFADLTVTVPDPPMHRGDVGPKVLLLTDRLHVTGDLPRRYWRFSTKVAGAVIAFQTRHRLTRQTGIVDGQTWVALHHSAIACRKTGRPEV